MKRFALRGLLLAAFLALAPATHAATRTWTGASGPAWNDPANWSGNVLPTTGDDLVFPDGLPNSASFNDLPSGSSFASITITGAHQITGNAMVLTDSLALLMTSPASATITFSPRLTLTSPGATIIANQASSVPLVASVGRVQIGGGALTANVVGNAAQVDFTDIIYETFPASLTKTGDGIARLAANNTYSGVTTVNGGYLGVGADNGLGIGTNTVADGTVVNAGGSLFLYNDVQVGEERVELHGAGQNGNGSFQTAPGGGNVRWDGDFVIADDALSLNSLATSLTIAGTITGPGSFRVGRSLVTITGANNYGGGTVVG